jgi:CelD/BcsL family acetyltransferase involved in cellulose biosynthesis
MAGDAEEGKRGMSLRIVRLALDDPRWVAFVEQRPEATPFHHPAWAGLLSHCYDYPALALCLEDGGHITSGVPLLEVAFPGSRRPRWVALPFTDHCHPLGRVDETLTEALDRARRAARVRRFELHAQIAGPGAYQGHPFLVHRLELDPDPGRVLERLHPSQVRRNIRRAQRSGVVVAPATTEGDVADAYYRLHVRTRQRLGVPAQPRRYFRLLWRRVLSRGLGYLLLASVDGALVAGAVFLSWNGTVVYKYGASDSDHWDLRPNHLIFWEAIQRSCAEGATVFDFGRTGLGDTGLRDFKRHWGTVEQEMRYTTLADRPPSGSSQEVPDLARAVFRRAPVLAVRTAGELLYRYMA